MRDISLRIKEIRAVKKMSQVSFANSLKVSSASISYYENGKRLPDYAFINALSIIHNVNTNWLITGEGPMFQELQQIDAGFLAKTIRLPIVAEIAAGRPCEAILDEPLGYVDLPRTLLSFPPPYLVFRVAGDSMAPHILPGDIVVCSEDFSGIDTNGKIMAFRNHDGITLKRLVVVPKQKTSWLMPINHGYQPVPYSEDTEDIVMIGIVDITIRKYNLAPT